MALLWTSRLMISRDENLFYNIEHYVTVWLIDVELLSLQTSFGTIGLIVGVALLS